MANKQELMDSIKSDMHLDRNFFLRVYGYEITAKGFSDQVMIKLEQAGCSKAREYYNSIVGAYEQEHEAMMKSVAKWYIKQDRKVVEKWERKNLQMMSNKDLIELLKNLTGVD